MNRIHHNGPRLGAFLLEEGLSLHALGVSHRDGAQDGVSPVQVAVDPVHRQPVGGLEVLADDGVVGEAGHSVDLGAEEGEGQGRGSLCQRPLSQPGSGWARAEAHL